MNKNKSLLIEMLLSDGSIYFDKSKRTYCIQFTNKISGMLYLFAKLMKKTYNLKNSKLNKCSNAVSIRYFSKKIALDLLKYCKSFTTKNNSIKPIIPKEIIENKKLLCFFLSAYCSCDGCVYSNKSHFCIIEIACANNNLKDQLFYCFKKLNIKSKKIKKGIIISKKSEIKKFALFINFLPESLVSHSNSKNFGVQKRFLLNFHIGLSH